MRRSHRVLLSAAVLLATLAGPRPGAAAPFGIAQIIGGAATYSASGLQLLTSPPTVPTGMFSAASGTTFVLAPAFSFAGGGAIGSFVALPGVTVSATALPGSFSTVPCADPPALGQGCTPFLLGGASPLSMYNTANGSVAALSLNVTVEGLGQPYTGTGIVTMQFAQSYQEVLTTLASGGRVESSYSAQLNAGTAGTFDFGGALHLSASGLEFVTTTARVGGMSGGQFLVSPLSSGLFSAFTGTSGLAADVGAAPIPDFLRFAANPTLAFDLASLDPAAFSSAFCGAPPASGQGCSLPGQAFEFVNITNGSVLSFNVDGLMSDLSGDTPYEGIYSMQFLGLSYQQVLEAAIQGRAVTALYSATFAPTTTSTVPEPLALVLIGAATAVTLRRRRREH
jgi:hypothetical protein